MWLKLGPVAELGSVAKHIAAVITRSCQSPWVLGSVYTANSKLKGRWWRVTTNNSLILQAKVCKKEMEIAFVGIGYVCQ